MAAFGISCDITPGVGLKPPSDVDVGDDRHRDHQVTLALPALFRVNLGDHQHCDRGAGLHPGLSGSDDHCRDWPFALGLPLARNVDVDGDHRIDRGGDYDADGGGDRHGHARIDLLDLNIGNDRHHDPRVSYHDGTRS